MNIGHRNKIIGVIVGAFLLLGGWQTAVGQPPATTVDGDGLVVFCAAGEQIAVQSLDAERIFVECLEVEPVGTPIPTETAVPPTATSEPTIEPPTATPEPDDTPEPTSEPEPPTEGAGDVGLYPNCIAPAIALETHSWWHEDGAAVNDINHMHLGTCYPNARPNGGVEVGGTLEVPVRIVLYNYPTTIDFVRYQWQGDTQQVNDIDFACGGDYEQCIGWTTLSIDTSQQNTGIDELRMSPNIGDNPFGARHFITLNFQSDNGSGGSYRNTVAPIARSWYSGGSYLRVQWNDYMDLFAGGEVVPVVSGDVNIDVRHSGDGCDVSTGYVDPAFHPFHAGNAAEPVPFYEVDSCFDGDQVLDTTLLSNGEHTVYLQSCGDRGTGNLCTAMAYQIDVQN